MKNKVLFYSNGNGNYLNFVLYSKDLLVIVLLLFALLPSSLFSIAESFVSSL